MRSAITLILIVSFSSVFAADGIPQFTIETVAGTGKDNPNTDEGPAREAGISHPTAVALDSNGNLYIADHNNRLIRKVDPAGNLTNVMGTGKGARLKDHEGIAREMPVSFAYGVAVDAEDNLYVLSRGQHVIYKVTPDGRARVIAGNAERGYGGDNGPALEASFDWPNHLVADPEGNIYVCDTGNHRIRKIDSDGIITTIGGTGEPGYSGDGGPATEGQLNAPSAIAIDDAGALYIADFNNHRIRKIDTDGIITTIGGTGEPKYNGDGLPALEANIGEPCGVEVDGEGNVYIGDQVNRRMRVVTPGGTMHTVAGKSGAGYAGDGGSATEARIQNPDIIAFGPDGALYFPDNQNNVIRKLVPALPGHQPSTGP